MPVNYSGKWLYLTGAGEVHEGDNPPDGSTVLAAPGGTVPDDLAERHGLSGRLGKAPAGGTLDAAGGPIVYLPSGRAVSAETLPAGDPRRPDAKHVQAPPQTKHQPAPKAKAEGDPDDTAEHRPQPKGK